jgi:hypothetical protein
MLQEKFLEISIYFEMPASPDYQRAHKAKHIVNFEETSTCMKSTSPLAHP